MRLPPSLAKLAKRYLRGHNVRCYALWTSIIVTGYVGMILIFHTFLDVSNDTIEEERSPLNDDDDFSESNIQRVIQLVGGRDLKSRPIRRGYRSSGDAETCPEYFTMIYYKTDDLKSGSQQRLITEQGFYKDRLFRRPSQNFPDDGGYLGCKKLQLNESITTRFIPLGKHFVYSAYFDDRLQKIVKVPEIRIIALMRKVSKTQIGLNSSTERLFCHFRYDEQRGEGSRMVEFNATFITVPVEMYEMCENHAKDYGGWILSCQVPVQLPSPPCVVSVSTSASENYNIREAISLPVFWTQPAAVRAGFAVCVPPLFGNISARTLLEFVELGRMLGAEHFIFYSRLPVVASLRAYLAHYVDLGLATVVPWTVPVEDPRVWYNGQLLAINDCLYRTMHAFRFVAFNDLDEFIVPHRHSDWLTMIASFRKRYQTGSEHCGYSFRSAFFETLASSSSVSGGTTSNDVVAYELESSLRTRTFSRVRTKVIVDPRTVFELGIHHISRLANAECRVVDVDPTDGFVHHYRQCVRDFDAMMNCVRLCQDETLYGYIPTMRRHVRETVDAIQAKVLEKKRTKGQMSRSKLKL